MRRLGYLAALLLLSSSADAGEQLSFVIGGHRIQIEAPRHCRSASCVAVSIPGIYETRRRRDRYDDFDDARDAVPAKPLVAAPAQAQATAPVSAPPAIPPAGKPAIQSVACAPPQPATVGLAASATQEVAAPPASRIRPPETRPITPPAAAPIETPTAAARPAPAAAPEVLKISRDMDDGPAPTPLGDWETEGNKGSVRIEQCGRALCGYILHPSSSALGETVLSNMMPKAALQWSGNIFSRDSGNTYYATMAIKDPNTLRVEACAVGRFFCTGNVWSRIGAPPQKLVTDRQISSAPRS
jgi:Uncharacterized protein conserved in bacteria (DUF2147)